MSERDPQGFASGPTGASAPGGEDPQPVWMIVRACADLPWLPRHHIATADISDPAVRRKLQSGLMEILPAAEQPRIRTGPGGQPELANDKETLDAEPER